MCCGTLAALTDARSLVAPATRKLRRRVRRCQSSGMSGLSTIPRSLQLANPPLADGVPMDKTAESPALPLSVEQIAQLRTGFKLAVSDLDRFAEHFYGRLFELAPEARALFGGDLGMQRQKFAQTLSTVLAWLEQPAMVAPELRQLGARHVHYGTRPQHYAVVGEALLVTLLQALPPDQQAALRPLWQQVYGWLASQMLIGASSG